MSATIRQLSVDDWRSLRDLRLQALTDSPGAFFRSYEEAVTLDADSWRSLFTPEVAQFQAEANGEAIGLAVGMPPRADGVDAEAAHLVSMWVAPSARGSGVAGALVDAVANWARERGHPRLVLWVYDANPRAAAFYRRAGFAETGVQTSDPGRGNRHLMTLTL